MTFYQYSQLINWLNAEDIPLDFELFFVLSAHPVPAKGAFLSNRVAAMGVTSYKWWPEALIEETQHEVHARRLSAADTAPARLVLKPSLSITHRTFALPRITDEFP